MRDVVWWIHENDFGLALGWESPVDAEPLTFQLAHGVRPVRAKPCAYPPPKTV